MSLLPSICLIYPDLGALKNIFKNMASSLFSNYGNVSFCKKSRKSTKMERTNFIGPLLAKPGVQKSLKLRLRLRLRFLFYFINTGGVLE